MNHSRSMDAVWVRVLADAAVSSALSSRIRGSVSDRRKWHAELLLRRRTRGGSGTARIGRGRCVSGRPAVWAWDLGKRELHCTVPPDVDRTGCCSGRRRRCDGRLGGQLTVGIHIEDVEVGRRRVLEVKFSVDSTRTSMPTDVQLC